jgi:starch synthase
VLQVSAELAPWVKTGGLADFNAALSPALRAVGVDARLLLPGFRPLLEAALPVQVVGLCTDTAGGPAVGPFRLLAATLGEVPVYLIDAPDLYRRPGTPYGPPAGGDWPDNDLRFGLLSWVAAHLGELLGADCDGAHSNGLGQGEAGSAWTPDIVHGHDWHAGLVAWWLHERRQLTGRGGASGLAPVPRCVMTVHNLAYQGLFDASRLARLGLPADGLVPAGFEFHGRIGFMKAALVWADAVLTVSPTHAREILTPDFGCGLEGVLRMRARPPEGILNGVDPQVWNPASDARLPSRYDRKDMAGKAQCRARLQTELGLDPTRPGPLVGVVSRLTGQKGIDLLMAAMPDALRSGASLALLGSGDPALELALRRLAIHHAGSVAVRIGQDEALAHRLIAGADLLAVPSRYEPCGLTQLYALAYGTLPLVRRTGGLADTVHEGRNGFVFEAAESAAIAAALARARRVWRDPPSWQALQRNAMSERHDWRATAQTHLPVYESLMAEDAEGHAEGHAASARPAVVAPAAARAAQAMVAA